MSDKSIDTLFLSLGPNTYYLSGLLEEQSERLFALIVPVTGNPFFVVPQLHLEQVRESSWIEDFIVWRDTEDPKVALCRAIEHMSVRPRAIGVDSRMWSRFLLMLLAIVPKARYEDAASVMNELRIRKTGEEIELLEKAAHIADAAFLETVRECRQGVRERQVAANIVCELRKLGADGIAFEPIVASGPNAAIPHHKSGDRELQRGDLVVLDYGCLHSGYNSDITRTVAISECNAKWQEAYDVVRAAQEEGCQKAAVGVEAQCVDRATRKIIEDAGYGKRFVHRTGHGIGLEIHEEPYIVAGNSTKLADGMVFSVEPGIYIPGQCGVRIEDIVIMDAGKARRLNKCARELVIT